MSNEDLRREYNLLYIGGHTFLEFCYSSILDKVIEATPLQSNNLHCFYRDILAPIEAFYGKVRITQGLRDMEIYRVLLKRWKEDQAKPAIERKGYSKPALNSDHFTGDAVDIAVDSFDDLDKIYLDIIHERLPYRALILHRDHLHISQTGDKYRYVRRVGC